MRVASDPQTLTIDLLTAAWLNNSIRPNPEYQRGSTWKLRQQQLLVDSVLRGYPLPRFYFEQKVSQDFLGHDQKSLEVIDGQQRLIALSQFRQDQWPLFSTDDERIPLPPSIRGTRVSWSGKVFSSLSENLQERFLAVELSVVVIDDVSDDEVRDLFIRLQSGTPLTAQQVRDAWPGNIGPFIERLAGKGTRQGAYTKLFAAIDRRGRGSRSDEEYDDPFLEARQTCAQLLILLIAKERGRGYPSLRGPLLNDLYHENTDFDTHSQTARKFEELLALTEQVVDMRPLDGRRKAVRKSRLFSLFLFLRTLTFSPVDVKRSIPKIAENFWSDEQDPSEPLGTVTNAETIEDHYLWMLQSRMSSLILPELDRNRLFPPDQKAEIWSRAAGVCGICGDKLQRGDEEYDHIKPWILGGQTIVENGRPVHKRCHRRGLLALDGGA